MNTGLIGTRYAKALFDFSKKNKSAERVYVEAKKVSESFFKFSQLNSVLENPVMLKAEKKKIILMAGGGNVSLTFTRFIDLLLQNNREYYLQSIVLRFIDLYREQNNIHFGKLTTAIAIDESTVKRMIAMASLETGGILEIDKEINPELIGGFTLEVDFKRWDASVSGQLNSIRKEYLQKNRNIV
ncbi:MAG: F0F1 ATP synthase subunit delta [Paludibacter sp.]|nr:F0F1 ATP synthase subunit delta [Paludibacter sp.]